MLVRSLISYLLLAFFLNIAGSLINTVIAGDQPPTASPPSGLDLSLDAIRTVKKGEYFFNPKLKLKLDYFALVEAIARAQQKPFTTEQARIITKAFKPTSSRRNVMINKWPTGFQEALSPNDQALACIMLAAICDTTNLLGDTERKKTNFEKYVGEWATTVGLYIKDTQTQQTQKSDDFSHFIEKHPICTWWVDAPETMFATLANSDSLSEITFLADLDFCVTLQDKYQSSASTVSSMTVSLLENNNCSNLKELLANLNNICPDKKVILQAFFTTLTDYQKQLEGKSSPDDDTDSDDDPTQVIQLLNAVKETIKTSKDTMLPILASLYSNGHFLTYQPSSLQSQQELQEKVTLLETSLASTKETAEKAAKAAKAAEQETAKQLAALQSELDNLRTCDTTNSFIMSIPDFSTKVGTSSECIHSPYYLTDQQQQCRLRLYPSGFGDVPMRKKTISLYFQLNSHRLDAINKEAWPFSSRITFSLLDGKDKNNVVHAETFLPDRHSPAFKMPKNKKANPTAGCPHFVTFEQAKEAVDKRDCLHIKCTIEKEK